MIRLFLRLLVIILVVTSFSCGRLQDYLRDPETESLVTAINTAALTGYSANVAMAAMQGFNIPEMTFSRSNQGFPCTALMVLGPLNNTGETHVHETVSTITIAGLWVDTTTAILTLLFTDYHTGSSVLDLVGIKTIPVIRDGINIRVVMASQDIQLNPDQESLLQVNLNTLEVESELLRLGIPRTDDVYVAVLQDAYFIDVHNLGTADFPYDDSYTITGGGQLIEITENEAEIIMQGMVDIKVQADCLLNPAGGMALVRVTGVQERGFPELGTALFEFSPDCTGSVYIPVATGMYASAIGKYIDFHY